MSELKRSAILVSRLYRHRIREAYAAYIGREPLMRLRSYWGLRNPYPIYDRMRERGPLWETGRGGLITASYRVCDAVLRDRRFGVRAAHSGTEADPNPFILSLLTMNPPDHTRLRHIVTSEFPAKAIAGYRDRIENSVGSLLDDVATRKNFDLVSAISAPLPVAVISEFLGIPDSSGKDFAYHGVLTSLLDGIRSVRQVQQLESAAAELTALFERLFELRRREPGDDLVSHIVRAEGDQIKPREMVPLCVMLLLAGFETTVNLIGNGVLALLAHPDQWQALCAQPRDLAAMAVEEALRFDPPVQLTVRRALEPLELEGMAIRKGQLVTLLIGAANRDPEVYDRPGEFIIQRADRPPHLAFSNGIHYCAGQGLARLEAAVTFQLLAERMPGLHRHGMVRRHRAVVFRGLSHLPVSQRPVAPRRVSGAPAAQG